MNLLVVKVVAKHALLVGGIAAAATVARDTYVLNTKKNKK